MSATVIRDVQLARTWKARHPNYPLVAHASGQWSKKIRGRVRYFGVLGNPDAALRLWLQEKDYLLAGMAPPTYTSGLTVDELLAKHLQDVDDRIAADKLSRWTAKDYRPVRALFRDSGLLRMPVKALKPEHFAAVLKALEGSGRSLRSQKNVILAAKAVFNWGYRMELFDRVRFGPRFVAPSSTAIEVEQESNGRCRFIDRDVILAALAAARPKMRVAILLGINCGFYPGDSIAIPLDHLHLDGAVPYHDFRRVKTGQRRMAALWPETVAAIRRYCDTQRRPAKLNECRLLLTWSGEPHLNHSGVRTLMMSFSRLFRKIGAYRKGVSIGSLRHTYGTVVDLVPDQAMIDLTMGHTNKSLQKRVYSQLNLNELPRLKVVADTVREWLFGEQLNAQLTS